MDYKFVNTEYLDSVSGGDNQIIIEIIGIFREQVVEMYDEMSKLMANKDYKSLGMLAHKAKSSVAIMGMNDLADMLKTFELQAKESQDTELYESYIDRFKKETTAAVTELDDLIEQRKYTSR